MKKFKGLLRESHHLAEVEKEINSIDILAQLILDYTEDLKGPCLRNQTISTMRFLMRQNEWGNTQPM